MLVNEILYGNSDKLFRDMKQHYRITLTVRNVLVRYVSPCQQDSGCVRRPERRGVIHHTVSSEFQGDEAYFRVNRGWHAIAMTCAKFQARMSNDNKISR